MKRGGYLSKIFTAFALAGSLAVQPESAEAQSGTPPDTVPASPSFPASSVYMPVRADTTDYRALWERIMREDSRPYEFGRHRNRARDNPSRLTTVVQAESGFPSILALLLDPHQTPLELLERHGEAAAAILNSTADRLARENIEVRLIEPMTTADTWFYNPSSPYARALFSQNDFISWSMKYYENGSYSAGEMDTAAELEAADEFFRQWGRETIVVVSAGNDGKGKDSNEVQRPSATMLQRARLLARVGEAGKDKNGYFVASHSSPAGTSFITPNPWFEDNFAYPFYRSGRDQKNYFREVRDRRINFEGREMSVGQAFGEILKARADYILQDSLRTGAGQARADSLYSDPSSCHPRIGEFDVQFQRKDRLRRDPVWQSQHPEEVLQALDHCLRRAAADIQQELYDQFGEVRRLEGTSWSSPYATAWMSSQHHKYPGLAKEDILAAALIAAEPVDRLALADGSFAGIAYRDNGRGLPVDLARSGFGVLLQDNYIRTIEDLLKILQEHPEMATQPASIESEWISLAGGDLIEIEVPDDILAMRVNIAFRLREGLVRLPDIVSVVSPSSGEVQVPVTVLDTMEVSTLSTDYLMGNPTRGTWRLRIPSDRSDSIEAVKINIEGVQRNGLIDEYFRRHIDPLRVSVPPQGTPEASPVPRP